MTGSRPLAACTDGANYSPRSWTRGMLRWRSTSTSQNNGWSPNPPRSSPQAHPSARIRTPLQELLVTQDSLFLRPWGLSSRGGTKASTSSPCSTSIRTASFQSCVTLFRLGRAPMRMGPASSLPSAARFLPTGSPRLCGSERSISPQIHPSWELQDWSSRVTSID